MVTFDEFTYRFFLNEAWSKLQNEFVSHIFYHESLDGFLHIYLGHDIVFEIEHNLIIFIMFSCILNIQNLLRNLFVNHWNSCWILLHNTLNIRVFYHQIITIILHKIWSPILILKTLILPMKIRDWLTSDPRCLNLSLIDFKLLCHLFGFSDKVFSWHLSINYFFGHLKIKM